MTGWHTSAHSERVDPVRSCLSHLSIVMVEPTQNRNGDHFVRRVAEGTENTIPTIIEAVKTYGTLGEIMDVFRSVFGE